MGNTASNINWNPGDSPLWKGTTDWDPRNSTLGQMSQGNWGETARGLEGGFNNAFNLSKDLTGAVVAYGQALGQIDQSISGVGAAADRRKKLLDDQNADNIAKQQRDAQAQYQFGLQQQGDKKNQDYLAQMKQQEQNTADEDAFIRARNAARQAKGTALYGGYNG